MLRSYAYSENDDLSLSHKAQAIVLKELEVARQSVEEIRKTESSSKGYGKCPVCGRENNSFLYQKWEVPYFLCGKCQSIYCQCEDDVLDKYKENRKMNALRKSEEYQHDAVKRRSESWEELIQWLCFRLYRYLAGKKELSVIDIGNRYTGFINMMREAEFCGQYNLRESILSEYDDISIEKADVILYINGLQQDQYPEKKLEEIRNCLKEDGVLILASRAGSGFDILALQEKHEYIYPYEHITLPSVSGLLELLCKTGYEVMEVTTPGVMDVNYVYANRDQIKNSNLFLQSMMYGQSSQSLHEFQRYLQKNCMSSYVQIIAKRKKYG